MKKRYYVTPKLELDNTELLINLHKVIYTREKKMICFRKRSIELDETSKMFV